MHRTEEIVINTGPLLALIAGMGNLFVLKQLYRRILDTYQGQTLSYSSLRRRSHKGRNFIWKRFEKLIRWLIPRVIVVHPFPSQRFQRYYPR